MAEIIGVRFKSVGKVYYFDPGGLMIETGGHVIVETARGRGWSRREYRTGARAFKNGKAFEGCG